MIEFSRFGWEVQAYSRVHCLVDRSGHFDDLGLREPRKEVVFFLSRLVVVDYLGTRESGCDFRRTQQTCKTVTVDYVGCLRSERRYLEPWYLQCLCHTPPLHSTVAPDSSRMGCRSKLETVQGTPWASGHGM
jgi:hypothetical protein